jgi:hypothetical protein
MKNEISSVALLDAGAFGWVSVTQAMKLLGRSRRHVYRYTHEGVLHIATRIGPCLLLHADSVHLLSKRLSYVQKNGILPPSGKFLFPEYSLKSLHPLRHEDLILARVLDRGSFPDIRWALDFYPQSAIAQFVHEHGTRLLSKRSLHFWTWYLNIQAREPSPFRRMGQELGGMV